MEYSVIRVTNFMGVVETEKEATFDTIEQAEKHIEIAKEQEKNIMGNVISNFEIEEEK